MQDHVTLLGVQENPRLLLQATDVYLLPSVLEALSLSVAEGKLCVCISVDLTDLASSYGICSSSHYYLCGGTSRTSWLS